MGFDLDKWGLIGALLVCNLPEETFKKIEAEIDEPHLYFEKVSKMPFRELIVEAHRLGVRRMGDTLNTDVAPFKIPESLLYKSTMDGRGREWLMARYKEHLIQSQRLRPKAWDGLLSTILMDGGIECDEDQKKVLADVIRQYFEQQGKEYYT